MSHTYTKENPLAQNFNIKSLLKFAFPTILTMIFMGLYTMIDTAFVSRFVDTNALSALRNLNIQTLQTPCILQMRKLTPKSSGDF